MPLACPWKGGVELVGIPEELPLTQPPFRKTTIAKAKDRTMQAARRAAATRAPAKNNEAKARTALFSKLCQRLKEKPGRPPLRKGKLRVCLCNTMVLQDRWSYVCGTWRLPRCAGEEAVGGVRMPPDLPASCYYEEADEATVYLAFASLFNSAKNLVVPPVLQRYRCGVDWVRDLTNDGDVEQNPGPGPSAPTNTMFPPQLHQCAWHYLITPITTREGPSSTVQHTRNCFLISCILCNAQFIIPSLVHLPEHCALHNTGADLTPQSQRLYETMRQQFWNFQADLGNCQGVIWSDWHCGTCGRVYRTNVPTTLLNHRRLCPLPPICGTCGFPKPQCECVWSSDSNSEEEGSVNRGRGSILTCGDVERNPGPATPPQEQGESPDSIDQGAIQQNGRFYCPVPGCQLAQESGKGWLAKSGIINHINNYHMSLGETPGKSWLKIAGYWACAHCRVLHPSKRKAPTEDCLPAASEEGTVPIGCQRRMLQTSDPLRVGTPMTAHWLHAPALTNILGKHVTLVRHIPSGAMNVWGRTYASLLTSFSNNPTWESFADMLLFPKCTLGLPHRGGKKHKNDIANLVRGRVTTFTSEGWLACWGKMEGSRAAMPRTLKRKRDPLPPGKRAEDQGFLASLQGLMDDGAFSKAAKHLLSEGVHDSGDLEIHRLLENLHPKRHPPQYLNAGLPWEVDSSLEGLKTRLKELRRTVMSFPLGSAGGPSGLRPQHLQDCIQRDVGIGGLLLTALDTFVCKALEGNIPQQCATFLAGAKLIPLRKPGAKLAVRPVAVGECLRRIVGKVAMQDSEVREAIQQMVPTQIGVGVQGACETTAIAIQNWVEQHVHQPNWAILQVDVKNAFNSIDRQAVLDAVHDRIPKLTAWTIFCYSTHSQLFLGTGHPLTSEQGVQQGDPLGPLLYSLAWQAVVEKLPPQLLLNLWYLDDGHLIGDISTLEAALCSMADEGAKIGIVLNPDKCVIWGPGCANINHTHQLAKIPVTPWLPDTGVKVLGLPVSYPSSHGFAEVMFGKVIDKVQESCQVLQSLGDPQTQHLLLRYCLDACTVMHFLRGVDCTQLQHQVQRCSNIIRRTWADVIGANNLSNEEWLQSTLPLRLAGMGIKDPLVVLAPARVAACLTFAVRARELDLPPESCMLPADIIRRMGDLTDHLGPDSQPLEKWITSNIRISEIEQDHVAQKWWTHKIHRARAAKLERLVPLRDKVRLTLQKMPATTSWMTVTPNEGLGRKIEGRDYRYILKWWLGRPIVDPACRTCPCCEGPMDMYGDHLVSCKHNQPLQRHNNLRDALANELQHHGLTVLKEVAVGGSRRPADLGLPNFDPRGPTAIDLVIHHPLSLSENRSSDLAKASLKNAEVHKIRESQDICNANGWMFAPMGWHPWAGVGPHGAAIRTRLEKEIAGDLQGWPRRTMIQSFRASLTFTLISFIAKQLRAAEDALPDIPGDNPHPTPFTGGNVFTPPELQNWDEPEELFVGPIRFRGIRPAPKPAPQQQ